MTPNLHRIIATATNVFEGIQPFRDVRLPHPIDPGLPIRNWIVSALWTTDGLRPRWQRLAVVANTLSDANEIDLWKTLLQGLSIPLCILSLANRCIVLARTRSSEIILKEVPFESLAIELNQHREDIFSPRALSRLRPGQLSFSDLEETYSEEGFSLLARHRASLDTALERGIAGALDSESQGLTSHRRKLERETIAQSLSRFESVLMFTVAYLAARILEDKGYFGLDHRLGGDPDALLRETITRTNGFFKTAIQENLRLESKQQLALHLGPSTTFSLVDHHDVGRLYEKSHGILQAALEKFLQRNGEAKGLNRELLAKSLLNLQQHYTPIALAEEMLARLPLERLRPTDRIVFDPAAGSGSLLLAATKRLASMPDTPLGMNRKRYLSDHVAGNDYDHLAGLVTKLRYLLMQESIGADELFPEPSYFEEDFRDFSKQSLPVRARVLVANPPFAEVGQIQRAAAFVRLVLTWVRDGDQFAFVLPRIFLTGSSHGIGEVRREVAERCNIMECWQLPEGVVGLTARQAVCVVLGEVGKTSKSNSVARAVLSSAKKELIRDSGFLGHSWVSQVPIQDENWAALVAPPIELTESTIPLGSLFHVFSGVTPDKNFPPLPSKPPRVRVKRYWKLGWKEVGRLWADPDRVSNDERYIRYGKEYLHRASLKNEALYDNTKVLVGRSVNVNASDPIAALLDTTGFCPNNDIYCVCSIESTGGKSDRSRQPIGWTGLDEYHRLLWLVGILSSELARDLSLLGRDSRHFTSSLLRSFDLPTKIDEGIIEVAGQMVARDMEHQSLIYPDPLREELNSLVEASYGNPYRLRLVRTGALPELAMWEKERRQHTTTVIGQVLELSPSKERILLHLNGLLDEEQEAWVPQLPELPGWTLDGTVFNAELSDDVRTFGDLENRPWALRRVKHTPRPYKSFEELEAEFVARIGSQE